jgi:hypothetical protein
VGDLKPSRKIGGESIPLPKDRDMKTMELSDETFRELERIFTQVGISPEENVKCGINEYLRELKLEDSPELEV